MKLKNGSLALAVALLAAAVSSAADDPDKLLRPGTVAMRHGSMIISISFSPDGKHLASGGWDNLVRIWDTATGKEVMTLKGHASPIYNVAYSPDGKQIASGGQEHLVRIWDAATGKEAAVLNQRAAINRLAFTRDGKSLVVCCSDGTLSVWDMATSKQVRTLPASRNNDCTFALSPDGKYLAASMNTNDIHVFEMENFKEVRKLTGHENRIVTLVFSPDSRTLVSGSNDMTLRVWELASGKQVGAARKHTGNVWGIAISPDGRIIAAGLSSNTVHLWEAITGTEIRQLAIHKGGVPALAFTPDGKYLASASHDASCYLWEVSRLVTDGAVAPAAAKLSKEDLGELENALMSANPLVANKAVWQLVATPKLAVPFLAERIRPPTPVDKKQIEALIHDLDSPAFRVRSRASRELSKMGRKAEEAIRDALKKKPSLEVRNRLKNLLAPLESQTYSPEDLLAIRGIEVLERIASPDARKALEKIIQNAPATLIADQGTHALKRLNAVSP